MACTLLLLLLLLSLWSCTFFHGKIYTFIPIIAVLPTVMDELLQTGRDLRNASWLTRVQDCLITGFFFDYHLSYT
jgi:hypothetical protein